MPKSLTLSHKLTLLIVAVVGAVLIVTLATTYPTVARTETAAAEEALGRVTIELARSAETSTRRRTATLRALGEERTIRSLLLGESVDTAQVREVLRRRLTIDGRAPIQFWNADGRPLTPMTLELAEAGSSPIVALPSRDDSVHFGQLFEYRDTVSYWTVSPIVDAAKRRIGWIGERRPIASTREEDRAIRGLVGPDVSVYFRNDTGSFWVSSAGVRVPAPAPAVFQRGLARYHRPGSTDQLLAAQADIRTTPWTLVLERPRSTATAVARTSFLRLGSLGTALLLLAAVAVWVLSRRFTRPIVAVAEAATSMAQGDYHTRIDERYLRRGDEVGRLASSFNDMASEVQAAHAELEQQVEEAQSLNEELEQTTREAEEANRAKSTFVTRMSHELRTPLNAIAGYTELLEMGIHGPVTSEQLEALQRIRRNQRALLALIDDVLNIARIEVGQVQYEILPVPLAEIVNEAEELVRPQLRARAHSLRIAPCPPTVLARGDRDKIRQVVANLLTNAIKFTERNGTIDISCRPNGTRVAVEVRDNGIGIPQDRLDVIFEPFVQLRDGLTRTAEGMGLGLAISRELARGMGGDLTVRSTGAGGSIFTLTLPAAAGSTLGDASPGRELETT